MHGIAPALIRYILSYLKCFRINPSADIRALKSQNSYACNMHIRIRIRILNIMHLRQPTFTGERAGKEELAVHSMMRHSRRYIHQ